MIGQQTLNKLSSRRPSDGLWVIHTLPMVMLVIAVLLVSILMALMLSILTGLHLGNMMVRPHPFAAYEFLWPGQPVTSVAEFARRTPQGAIQCYARTSSLEDNPGLVLHIVYGNDYGGQGLGQQVVCTDSQAADSLFRSMNVTLSGDQVQELILFSDVLQQDTLLLYWGAPDSIIDGKAAWYLQWNRSTYTATAMMAKSESAITLLTLTAK
jgi:hypothetical protein